jgi:hypothetical protein
MKPIYWIAVIVSAVAIIGIVSNLQIEGILAACAVVGFCLIGLASWLRII